MRKVTFFAVAAGAGVLLTGCPDDVMRDRHYIPAPTDNVPVVETTANTGIDTPSETSTNAVKPVTQQQVYEPMTDVQSSEGVDSVRAADSRKVSGSSVYIVKRGDYPERIARKHKVSLKALMAANNLDDASARKLRVGQKLVIPAGGKSVAPKKSNKTVSSKKSGSSESAPVLQGGKYTIKRGDSPERIARRFKIKVSDLMKANNLDDASARRLQVGQKLVIPGKSDVPAEVPVEQQTTAPEQQTDAATTDTTTDAATTDTTTDATTPATKEENTVFTDQPVAVELDKVMTLEEIAKKYNVSEETLQKLNQGIDFDNLKVGDMFVIPAPKN